MLYLFQADTSYICSDGIHYVVSSSIDTAVRNYFKYPTNRFTHGNPIASAKVLFQLDKCILTSTQTETVKTYSLVCALSPLASTYALVRKLHPELFI